ncbi:MULTISPECIES: response regulator [unclassified Leptolyngbya]|uniref:response regulator transcription factor n=1 Tax=unclassified Leptolyngbya TaxID=2650499 RepID=UPI00168A2E3A|nr:MULTISPECIES: response regulator [unclassified Leptolyngbya]MBD1909724.1 response regulator [Leptolyngbya sp. FACHB-8]MBD2155990.1 response regulator [Leptolyngbya sp. FACHB-16]
MKILVVEDDSLVAKTLGVLLSTNNYFVDLSSNAENASQMLSAFEYDLIVLDVLLPDINGIELCQRLRSQGYSMPILLLTGQNDTQQKAIALNNGADDYVVKPFDPEELIARVQALLRRGSVVTQTTFTWASLQLDPVGHTAIYGTQPLALTPKEFAILELFLRNSQRILSSKIILEHAWTAAENPGEETVRVHIKELRRKLSTAGAPGDFIETLYRVGYRLKPLESVSTPPTPTTLSPSPPKTRQLQQDAEPTRTEQATLVITPSPDTAAQIKALLEPHNFQVAMVTDLTHIWTTATTYDPRLFILDSTVDGKLKANLELCQQIRRTPPWQNLPILMLLHGSNATVIEQVFAAGASDFVNYPIVGPELLARTRVWFKTSR